MNAEYLAEIIGVSRSKTINADRKRKIRSKFATAFRLAKDYCEITDRGACLAHGPGIKHIPIASVILKMNSF